MKKIFSLILSCLVVITAVAQTVQLSVPQDLTNGPGKALPIPVILNNAVDVTAVQFDVKVPLAVTSHTLTPNRCGEHEYIVQEKNNNTYRVMIYSSQNATISGTTGSLITFSVDIPEDAPDGKTYAVELSNVIIANRAGENVATGSSNGLITVVRQPRPDLKPGNVAVSQTLCNPGDAIDLSWDVQNIGDLATGAGWTEKIYLQDEDGYKVYVGWTSYSGVLEAGATINRNYTLSLPEYPGISGNLRPVVEILPAADCGELSVDLTNNTAYANNYSLYLKKYLTFVAYDKLISEKSTGRFACEVRRTGSLNKAETFDIAQRDANGHVGRLSISNEGKVTFGVGVNKTYFYVSPVNNNEVNVNQEVTLTLNPNKNNGYDTVTDDVRIEDDEKIAMTIATEKVEYQEGETIRLTVTAPRHYPGDLIVYFNIEKPGRFKLPKRLVMSEGIETASIEIPIIDDSTPANDVDIKITATAEHYDKTETLFLLKDNDVPAISMTLTPTDVSEAAGPSAMYGTIVRSGVTDNRITIKLSDDGDDDLYYSVKSITLPAGTTTANFPVGVKDNAEKEGDRVVNLKAAVYISDCNCDAIGDKQASVVVPITITDDDGPMLTLATDKSTILEGDANGCKLTISRNTTPQGDLTVQLYSRSEDLVFPETVIIPDGEKSVAVTLTARANDVEEGDRTVSMYASSDNYSMGTCWVLISDRTLPDIAIETSMLSRTALAAGESLQMHLGVKNIGAADLPAGTPVIIRANGNTVVKYTTQEAIGKGQEKELIIPMQASAIPGAYTITAEINPDRGVSELLYLNNTSEAHTLTVSSLYSFTIDSEREIYNIGEVVKFEGKLSAVGNANVAGVKVEPYILYSGHRIAMEATTDAQGAFACEYVIPDGYRGEFDYGVCNIGENKRDADKNFKVYGFCRADNSYLKHEIYLNEPYRGAIALKNLTSLPLTGLKAEVTGATDRYDLVLDIPEEIPGGEGGVEVTYTLTPRQISTGNNWETINLHFTTNEGATHDVTFYNYTRVHNAKLVASTTSISTTATKGISRLYPVILTNKGLAPTGEIKVSLPEGLREFISLATPEVIPSLQTNDSTTIMLRFTPGANLDVNIVQKGNIAINCENGNGISVYFNVKVVSEEKGGLLVKVRDENTIYGNKDGEHPYVANATVELKDYNTGKLISKIVTGEEGTALFENINEGYYQLYVTSPKHDSYRQNIVVSPGETLEHLATISYQAVSVSWDVVETEVEDEYEIVTTLTYETHVPVPVVRMTMPKRLNLDELEYGRSTLFNIVLRNDGLITAQNVWIDLFEVDGYTVTPLIQTSGINLGPECSYVIPVSVTRNNMSTDPVIQSSGGSACSGNVDGGYEWPCGSDSKFGWIGDVVNFFSENMSCSDAGEGGGIQINGGSSGGVGSPGGSSDGYASGAGGGVNTAAIQKLVCTLLECIPIDIPVPGEDCTRQAYNVAKGRGLSFGGVIGCISHITKKLPGVGPVISCLEALMKNYAPAADGGVKFKAKQTVTGDLKQWYDKAKIYYDYGILLKQALNERMGCTQLLEEGDDQVLEAIDLVDLELNDMFVKGELFNIDLNTIPDDYSKYEQAVAQGTAQEWMPAEGKTSAAHLTALMPGGVANWYDFELKAYVERIINLYRQENNMEVVGDNCVDFSVFESTSDAYDAVQTAIIDNHLVSIQELVESANNNRLNYFENQSSSTCASVKLEIEQKLVMTRQAFRGTLTVENSTAKDLLDIDLNVVVTNMLGEQTTQHEMQINFESITGFEGGLEGPWTLAPRSKGVATILFIPTKYAAPDTLTTYSFGGNLYFKDGEDGVVQSRELYPVKLQVKPSPELDLTYFVQRDIYGDNPLTKDVVEPVVPAEFSVLLHNKGKGKATDVRMLTKQPKIVENEKGLLVDFAIVSSSLNGGEKAMALDSTISTNFGDINAGASSYATWDLTSSLLGHFTEYDVSVNHVSSFNNPDLSLLDQVTIHELIRSVDLTLGDNVCHAWLTNDIPDGKDLPDNLYFTDGTTQQVADASSTTTITSNGNSQYTLTVKAPTKGWYYANIADPTESMANILNVSLGGVEINKNCIWQTQYIMPDNNDPLRDNRLHVVLYADGPKDFVYNIQFEPTPNVRLKVNSIETLPNDDEIAEQVIEQLTIRFNKDIQSETFTREDITLRHEGKLVETPINITEVTKSAYNLDMSPFTDNGFYTLQIHAENITDHEGYRGYDGLMGKWMLFKDGLIHYNIESWPSADMGNIRTNQDNASGTAEYGGEMSIIAEPAYGYEFDYWGNFNNIVSPSHQKSLGSRSLVKTISESEIEKISTENPIVVPLNKDIDLVAVFKPKKMKVNIICDTNAGTASVGSGFYDYGTVMNIEAAAKDGYVLKGFVVHDNEYQEGDEIEVTVDRDVVNVEVLFESTTPQNVLMQDTENYQPVDVPLANVKLYRSFRKGTWNTICLPCAVDNPTDVFGEGTRVARLAGLEDDVMQFATVNHMLPNIPYLIMVGSIENSSMENGASKRTFYDITNTSVVEPEYTQPIDQHDGVAFIGSYETTTVPAGQGYYYISSGALWYIDSNAVVTSGRFRGFFHASNSNTQTMGFRIDDIVTGVPAIEVTASDDVFDLSGIKVRNKGEELKDLDPGVYISRGKKFLIK